MSYRLEKTRVHFDAGDTLSRPVDLADRRVRAVVFPANATGTMRALTRIEAQDPKGAHVNWSEAVGVEIVLVAGTDESAPSWLTMERDWPLMETVFVLEAARDDPVDVILVTEPRGG